LRNIPFRQQEQVLFYVADRLPRFVAGAMDARGNGQYLAESAMQRYGARIRQVMLSVEWYRDNMPRYKAAFEDGLIELPRDAEILADHRALVMEQGVVRLPEQRSTTIKGKRRHGDAAIAGALAYFASQVETHEFSYQPAPAARHFGTVAPNAMRNHPEPEKELRGTARTRFGLTTGAW
jgi:phage FluMu gp28-like protein